MIELFALLVALGLGWFWLDALKAREIALVAGERACDAEGWQFLDFTVALQRLRLARDEEGRLRFWRRYTFEYSDTGNNRLDGAVVLLGAEVLSLNLATPPGPLPDNVVPLRRIH